MGDVLWGSVKKITLRRAVVCFCACWYILFINVRPSYRIGFLRTVPQWTSEQLTLNQLAPYDPNEVLVIVIGSLRGGAVAWNSLKQNVLDALGADLAYLGPDNASRLSDTFARGFAYDWHFDDLLDWGDFFDDLDPSGNWRRMCWEDEGEISVSRWSC